MSNPNNMQAFDFDLRKLSAISIDNMHSRHVPSSVYSGPGPAEESTIPSTVPSFIHNGTRGPFQDQQSRYNSVSEYG